MTPEGVAGNSLECGCKFALPQYNDSCSCFPQLFGLAEQLLPAKDYLKRLVSYRLPNSPLKEGHVQEA